jgi:MoxR-like ATPase
VSGEFHSVEAASDGLGGVGYLADESTALVAFLASRLGKPVLVEGPAGVGKTELAKTLSEVTKRKLIRLQCYEGLDEGKALYEWKYAKQLLYTQLLRERIGELIADAPSLPDAVAKIAGQEDAFFSFRFLSPRPLFSAILADAPVVLLVDEIDKAEPEFEAFLLEVLSDFQVTVPELGTVGCKRKPLVFLTSNNAREMSDALKRRCLHLYIDFPNEDLEKKILETKVPGAAAGLVEDLVGMMHRLRQLDLKKTPSISETLDWARALLALNAQELDADLVNQTFNVILKYEGDVRKAQAELDKLLQKKAGEARAAKPVAAPEPAPAATKKGALH